MRLKKRISHFICPFPVGFFFLFLFPVSGICNNVRMVPSAIVNNVPPIEFTVEWGNSWCDQFNYDGVYIFLKYKLDDKGQEWHHGPLRDRVGVTTLVAGNAYGSTLLSFTGDFVVFVCFLKIHAKK